MLSLNPCLFGSLHGVTGRKVSVVDVQWVGVTIIVYEFVSFSLVEKFHSEHPSTHPQTSPDYVLSSLLRNSIFFVFIGEI